jgi:penicillin-binding protein 1A
MEQSLRGTPVEVFPVPEGIVFTKVERTTGQPVKGASKTAIYECFLDDTLPGENGEAGPPTGAAKSGTETPF